MTSCEGDKVGTSRTVGDGAQLKTVGTSKDSSSEDLPAIRLDGNVQL